MALLESEVTPLGTPCPDFRLPGTDGRAWARADFQEPLLLVAFICNHCPYVQAVDDRLNQLAKVYAGRCAVVGISANDAVTYPADSFPAMQARVVDKGFVFPYLYDASQEVARAFGAVCTPDFFLYDAERQLRYRGRLDDNWKDAAAVTRHELAEALEALLAGREPAPARPSLGCSLKWKG